jgi:RNA-binding protein Tab2/Atab2
MSRERNTCVSRRKNIETMTMRRAVLLPLLLLLRVVTSARPLTTVTQKRLAWVHSHSARPVTTIKASTTTEPSVTLIDTDDESLLLFKDAVPSDQWEMDCYSRPVLVPGTNKKLWEVLVTDSTQSFQYIRTLPSNQVNSKTLRSIMEQLMDVDDLLKPSIIRFFRASMLNMISIALTDLPAGVVGKPSRCTAALARWLQQRHEQVYPGMVGYNRAMAPTAATAAPLFNVRTPVKLPDALRGEYYAFVGLPLAEFLPGGGVTPDNVGVGKLCLISTTAPADAFVPGIVVISQRAAALAAWLAGTEVVAVTADLRQRQLLMETDLDTQYLMARLDDNQRAEAAIFAQGCDELDGLHFISVQASSDDETPAGFWLLQPIQPNQL